MGGLARPLKARILQVVSTLAQEDLMKDDVESEGMAQLYEIVDTFCFVRLR
jgi:hypothetical protein